MLSFKLLACLFEDPETKKRRPRNYLQALEARVALLNDGRPSSPVVNLPSCLRTPDTQQESSRLEDCTGDDENNTTEHSPLSLQAGLLDVRSAQTEQTEPQYLGLSSTFAFSHIVNSSLCRHLPDRAKPLRGLLTRQAPSPSLCFLPDKELALLLSNAYFENIHPQYPFLHEATFRIWEQTAAARPHEGRSAHIFTVPLFFVNMVSEEEPSLFCSVY